MAILSEVDPLRQRAVRRPRIPAFGSTPIARPEEPAAEANSRNSEPRSTVAASGVDCLDLHGQRR